VHIFLFILFYFIFCHTTANNTKITNKEKKVINLQQKKETSTVEVAIKASGKIKKTEDFLV